MKQRLHVLLMAVFVLLVPAAPVGAASHSGITAEIVWDEDKHDNGTLWLAYLIARAAYIDKHDSDYAWKPGVVVPSFPEELEARVAVVKIYRDLKKKESQPTVAYFEQLGEVADNAFLGEYVWTYLHHAAWNAPPENLHLVDFMRWRAQHLPEHTALTEGMIRFAAKGAAADSAAAEPDDSELPTLLLGRKTLEAGKPELAIAAFYDPVIEHFARIYQGSGTRVYAARNQMQVLMYAALPNEEKLRVDVLDFTWSDAYLMKAYSLSELRRIDEAQAALKKAIALSPLTAQYVAELAYTYQAQGDCQRSIETYKQSESVAELGSDDTTKTTDLTRAWRGQGYCLTEQGRLDEAEALYRRCLKEDPADAKAKNELEYIRKLRGR